MLPTPFENTVYEFAIGEESFGFWDFDPNRPEQDYQLYCFDRKKFSLTAEDGDESSVLNRGEKRVELIIQKDTRDEVYESCYPIRDWNREIIQYQTYNLDGLTNFDGTSVAIVEPPYSRGLPQFFDCCGNSVLGFSVMDYFSDPEAYDTEDITNDLLSLDYSFGNYPFFSRRGLGANYTFNTRNDTERLQWSFSSNDSNYRWKSQLSFGTSPLEGGQFENQQNWVGREAIEKFWEKLEEYELEELKGNQGIPQFNEISSLEISTKNTGESFRNTPLYLNLTRQQITLGEKYVGDAVQANLLTKFKKEWLVSEMKGQEIAFEDEVEILINHVGLDGFNPELENRRMNFEVMLTQYREGSNPGVQSDSEDRLLLSLPIDMNSVSDGIEFSHNEEGTMKLIKADGSEIEKTIQPNSNVFTLTDTDQDILESYLSILNRFYTQLDEANRQYLESFFDVKSYASVYFNNNFINSSSPLWRSFDLFEGPIEYYDDNSVNFENLLFFNEYQHAVQIISGEGNSRDICIGIGNKTSDVVTARLAIKGPENYEFNDALPESNDLVLSSYQLNWASNDQPQCVSVRTSETYNDNAYDRVEAYYFIEIIPEISATTYRSNKFMVQVLDKYR